MSNHAIWLMVSALAVVACGNDGPDEASSSGGGAASASTSEGSGGSASSASSTGAGGAGGTGGTGGQGGAGGTGGTGGQGGGEVPCTPVTLGEFLLDDKEPGGSSLIYGLTGLSAGKDHVLYIEFFDVAGAQVAGSFDLSQPPDDNYSTCAHCLLAFEDFSEADPIAYFPESGTLQVTSPDVSYSGASAGAFNGVKLIEVTISGTKTTPVAGGKCLSLSGAWEHMP